MKCFLNLWKLHCIYPNDITPINPYPVQRIKYLSTDNSCESNRSNVLLQISIWTTMFTLMIIIP